MYLLPPGNHRARPLARLPLQRFQRLARKLPRRLDTLPLPCRQRRHHPVPPGGVRGQQHNPVLIGHQYLLARSAPALLQRLKADLDRNHTRQRSLRTPHRIGDEIPRQAGCGANGIKPPLPALQRLLEIGPEGVVLPDKTAGLAEIGGRDGNSVCVHQVNRIQPRLGSEVFQPQVQRAGVITAGGTYDRGIPRQHMRQMGKPLQLSDNGALIKRQRPFRLRNLFRLEVNARNPEHADRDGNRHHEGYQERDQAHSRR